MKTGMRNSRMIWAFVWGTLAVGGGQGLWAQGVESSIYNVPMAEYPKVDGQRRAIFPVACPGSTFCASRYLWKEISDEKRQ